MSEINYITKIMGLIAQIEMYSKEILDKNDPKEILELQETLLRLQAENSILQQVPLVLEALKAKEAEKINFDQTFKIGFAEFRKVRAFSNSKLDESKLEVVIPDRDNRELFYKKVPKPQKEVIGLLHNLGLNMDVDQLYIREAKEGFKIKQLN